jgi:outer membrane protein assembly factor BamE (lipoprotein component of BamABCDE complex)
VKRFHKLALVAMLLLSGCVMNTENPVVRMNRRTYLANNPQISPVYSTAIKEKRIIVGMTREQVMAAWGPPSTCSRAYGDRTHDTVCLYYDTAMVVAGRTTYTDRRYKSVHYDAGRVVDWQWH